MPSNASLYFHLLVAISTPALAAGWGICTGDDISCFTGDYHACTSGYASLHNEYGCKWFDFGWLIAGVVGISVVALVSLVMVFRQRSTLATLQKRLNDVTGETEGGGDNATTPLIRDEPTIPQGGGAWGKVGL